MILDSLKLQRYRNLDAAELAWHEQFNVIYGCNAQGKTNLLEAIYLLGNLKSFRNARGHELISHDEESAWVGGAIRRCGVNHRLDIALRRNGRVPRVDGKPVQRLSQFFGYLRTVLFTPEELAVVKGFPAGRRALLDRAILQTEPAYLDRVQEYDRILRQRNQLLKDRATAETLAPWSEALVRCGSRIRHDRLAYLERFAPHLERVYGEITGAAEKATLVYSVSQAPLAELAGELSQSLERQGAREKALGQTMDGPHRDDLEFLVDGRVLRAFGSQGQQRSFLLAFKAAQLVDLETLYGEPPVLLLDDLASELDQGRQEGFFNFLLHRSGQVFLTSAQRPQLAGEVRQTTVFYKVDRGMVNATDPQRG